MSEYTKGPDGSLLSTQSFNPHDLKHFSQTHRAMMRVASEQVIDMTAEILRGHPVADEDVVEQMSDEEYIDVSSELAGIILLECARIIHETIGVFTDEFESAIPRPNGGKIVFKMENRS